MIKNKIEKQQQINIVVISIGSFILGVLLNLLFVWISDSYKYTSWNDGKYYGDMSNGVPNGEGRFKKDGITYSGFWENGIMASGKIESDKYIYEGELNGTKFSGYGVAKYKDGKKYWGYWLNDYKHGLGLLKSKDNKLSFCFFDHGNMQIVPDANYNIGDKVYGIDISRYQGIIKWQDLFFSCNAEGEISNKLDKSHRYIQPVLFAIAKSTQGSKLRDSRFESNYSEAKRCGKVCGAYHFLTMTASGKEQAKYYIQNTPLSKGDFPPVLDFEKNNADGKTISDEKFAEIIPIAKEWIAEVKRYYKVSPIIYTNTNIYRTFIATDNELKKYDVWIASPESSQPNINNYILWQFSHNGEVNGIDESKVDINIFNGNYEDLLEYIKTKGIK